MVWIRNRTIILDPDKSKTQHSGLPVVETADGHALNNNAKTDESKATQSNFVLVVPVLLVEIWILQQNTQDCSVADPGCSEFFPSYLPDSVRAEEKLPHFKRTLKGLAA